MLASALETALEFIDAATDDDGRNAATVTENKYGNLLKVYRLKPSTSSDATATLKLLKDPKLSFTNAQRSSLRQAIIDAGTTDANHEPAGPKTITTTTTQSCPTYDVYMQNRCWDAIYDKSLRLTDVLEPVTDNMRDIGLTNPDERPTQVHIISIIGAVRGWDEEDSYDAICKLRELIAFKRKAPTSGAPHKLSVYPADIKDFLKMYPNTYPANDPPVCPRIDNRTIENAKRLVSSRGTNKHVRASVMGKNNRRVHQW